MTTSNCAAFFAFRSRSGAVSSSSSSSSCRIFLLLFLCNICQSLSLFFFSFLVQYRLLRVAFLRHKVDQRGYFHVVFSVFVSRLRRTCSERRTTRDAPTTVSIESLLETQKICIFENRRRGRWCVSLHRDTRRALTTTIFLLLLLRCERNALVQRKLHFRSRRFAFHLKRRPVERFHEFPDQSAHFRFFCRRAQID